MRDSRGDLLGAIAYPLQHSSPVEVELQAILYALRWAVDEGFVAFQVESDCSLALDYLSGKETRKWTKLIQEISLVKIRKGLVFKHTYREGNWAAHYLAAHRTSQLTYFDNPAQLPTFVRRAYLMDFFGIPSFRF
ncbi:unnamed protein product [Cuscuta europaea]|uniref:RNase H type-1 domain-containing protein n=1 Tax=Cuscuta europaea TaxID=41803 RepID=A0A9P1A0L0_CUSEU|nr:unnamed protein product [Cuscuta europaea]